MANITINSGSDDPVAVTVNCCCTPEPTPEPEPVPGGGLREAALHGFTAATVLPHLCNTTTSPSGPALVAATAILPAGKSIASVGVAVADPAQGEAFQPSRVAVYIGSSIAELGGASAEVPRLFTVAGWRWGNLETPVAAAEEDRVVWLVAQLPYFSVAMPGLLCAAQLRGPNMVNSSTYRSVVVQGATELPGIFDGDAVPFTVQQAVPALAASSRAVIQP
ncbi:hypothetical protein GCM10027187_40830 [Streptosporangium sandarakinum]|uniref:Uncharacterized protein n=1 Tax=Streptosporangium sandarakinum TaxID=1260955 RepID=A0A852VEG3_9ACTN|nr:hypothetical protein [Streptosporangium sandarakinum]NYF44585.1 hypothetical protein [Streptosporangium sandarakinum]